MMYLCDPCFHVFPQGEVTDVPGQYWLVPQGTCNRCGASFSTVTGSLGHIVGSYPSWPMFFGSGSL